MMTAFPPAFWPFAMSVARRCSSVVFANAVSWAAVVKLAPLKPSKPVSYLRRF